MSTPKTIPDLMGYLRDEKGLTFSGKAQEVALRNIGYYHAYKGYRYRWGNPNAYLPYSSFGELLAVYDFDMGLKEVFYPLVTRVEMTFRNHILEQILLATKSDDLNAAFDLALDNYRKYSQKAQAKPYKAAVKARQHVIDRIKVEIKKAKNRNIPIATHFLATGRPIPIWAAFEFLTFTDIGSIAAASMIPAARPSPRAWAYTKASTRNRPSWPSLCSSRRTLGTP